MIPESLSRSLLGLAALSLFACSTPPGLPTNGNGELHQGTFLYACSSAADATCPAGIAPKTLPSGIAIGADFELRYTPTSPTKTSLEPTRDFFSVDASGRFRAKRSGYGAVLVKDERGGVVDFVNLRVKAIASLAIAGIDENANLAVAQTRVLSAAPLDTAGDPLAGTVPLEWESSDPSVVTVTTTDDDRARGSATLRAIGAGTARIRVISGTATSTVSVRIGGA
jgi:hypothetical protein